LLNTMSKLAEVGRPCTKAGDSSGLQAVSIGATFEALVYAMYRFSADFNVDCILIFTAI